MAGTAASFARSAALSVLLALAACGEEPEAQARPFDFFVLALSWSPSYCAAEGERSDPQQCDQKLGFVVHGLWPQFEDGWPEYCDPGASGLPRRQVSTIRDVIPSDGLIRHQWRKHGTCTGLTAAAYFEATRAAVAHVALPAIEAPRASAEEIAAVFIEENEGLPQDGIAVTCAAGLFREVRLCMNTDYSFRSCPQVSARSCRQSGLRVPTP